MSKHPCALGATATFKKVERQSWSPLSGALQNFSATPGTSVYLPLIYP